MWIFDSIWDWLYILLRASKSINFVKNMNKDTKILPHICKDILSEGKMQTNLLIYFCFNVIIMFLFYVFGWFLKMLSSLRW